MSSQRLPGKSLESIGLQTLLGSVVGQICHAKEAGTKVVVTSTDASDDAIWDWCSRRGLLCMRGDLDDVAGRVLVAASHLRARHVVRISGDSPFIDPALIDHAIRLSRESNYDLVTNVFPRSFPTGQSVEVISLSALLRARQEGLSADQKEHVTRVFYESEDAFKIRNFSVADVASQIEPEFDYAEVRLSVDTPEDLARSREIIDLLDGHTPPYRWRECALIWLGLQRGGRDD